MLSSNDNTVLSQLFDPESAPSSGILVDASLPEDPNIQDPQLLSSIREQKRAIILRVESILNPQQQSAQRDQTLESAKSNLEQLIAKHPNSASLLNDHAQLLRLQHGNDLLSSNTLASEVLHNLNKAITLLTPASPQAGVSPAQCRTLAQAHTQRGALFHAASKALSSPNSPTTKICVPALETWTALDFEEAASRDFFMGGQYGNEVSRALAVHSNPTAKLCGQMVRDAMRREFEGASLGKGEDLTQ